MGESIAPRVEKISRRYYTDSRSHPFDGDYTALEILVDRYHGIEGDITIGCLAAKKAPAKTFAFYEGHRYDLAVLEDVMSLQAGLLNHERRDAEPVTKVRLKAVGHDDNALDSLVFVYASFFPMQYSGRLLSRDLQPQIQLPGNMPKTA